MKRFIFFLSIMSFVFAANAQTDSTADYYTPGLTDNVKTGNNGHWGMNAGGFASGSKYGSYYGSFLSPNYSLPLTDKFSLQAGFLFTSMHLNSAGNSEGNGALSQTLFNNFFYAQGTYKVSQKVYITGGAYTSLSKPAMDNLGKMGFDTRAQGGKIGIGYNINEKSSIYFEMELNKGQSPFNRFSSPFSTMGFGH